MKSLIRKLVSQQFPSYQIVSNLLKKYPSYSQASQDLFVLEVLGGLKCGTYLEVGAYEPIQLSNTFLLERKYHWDGISLEIDPKFAAAWKTNIFRKNPCFCVDALTIEWESFLCSHYPTRRINYLSLDIDPSHQSLKVLQSLPFNKFSFDVITFEHDSYRDGFQVRDTARKYLSSFGYKLVVADLECSEGKPFEDWFVSNSTKLNPSQLCFFSALSGCTDTNTAFTQYLSQNKYDACL